MDGILVVNKPQGMTSHDVVDFIRRRFSIKKVGHAGTLDPMATGVLVMLIGKYTKSSNTLLAEDKEYEAELVLGGTSDTGDAWGNIKASDKNISFDEAEIRNVFNKFLGEIDQHPPMYSAVKVNGRKLYELARIGLSVDRKPRKIVINRLGISKIELPRVSFELTCSKGTYVRQLCSDIGEALGCGAYLSRLNRTRSGRFAIDKALELDTLRNFKALDLEERLLIL